MANRFQLWGQAGWASAEVVGETHYAKAIRALFGDDFNPQGTDITVPVQLIPDRNNRHDRNAVGVWSGSSLLGHLPRPEAARYVQVLTSLTARDLIPEVNARITGREWVASDGRPAAFDATIRLDLAEPHMLVPANSPPLSEHRLLPSGSAVQVVGQQPSLDALRLVLRPEGECWAYVTLHEMADHLVEVRLGEARVGDLSPKMSGELLPVLRHMAEQGLVTAARAIVRGSTDKNEVMLYIARVQDLPESWQAPARRPAAAPAPGRGTASVPGSGVATGPATPGTTPTPAGSPVMSGGPASGGLVPNWVTTGEPLPSWAAPATMQPPVSPAGPSGVPAPAALPVPGHPASLADLPPSWASAADDSPQWAEPGAGLPSWAVPSNGVPTWAAGSSALPGLPATGSLPGAGVPYLDPPATRPVPQTSTLTEPMPTPVSGVPDDVQAMEIAETTVIPALAAVVKANSGALSTMNPVSAVSPVSPAADPHPPIPPAPTGIRFVVPPDWPTPPAGWYPPDGWRPDPAWPPAPAGWQWWVPAWD
ncbi:hypothetical protein Aca07nite_75010 [Actinoplanes capillaceus]|uniref:Uncharacterized protein n=1 Tax=Actinoplanes campanulatus TaxID=113559 RepID=A0ABQ3WVA2_9ACTN|nr:hypothetical protein [Actinoplanes capillaceus]GID50226.1 hypothetical protein Aca07nite_75010 [Actinoplanes capillaceus]